VHRAGATWILVIDADAADLIARGAREPQNGVARPLESDRRPLRLVAFLECAVRLLVLPGRRVPGTRDVIVAGDAGERRYQRSDRTVRDVAVRPREHRLDRQVERRARRAGDRAARDVDELRARIGTEAELPDLDRVGD